MHALFFQKPNTYDLETTSVVCFLLRLRRYCQPDKNDHIKASADVQKMYQTKDGRYLTYRPTREREAN